MSMKYFGLAAACILSAGLMVAHAAPVAAQGNEARKFGKPPLTKGPAPQANRAAPPPQHGNRSGHSGHRSSNTGRNIAAGVAAGVVGAIILNEVARANGGGYSTQGYRDGGLSCDELEYRCDRGQDWACRKLDRNSC